MKYYAGLDVSLKDTFISIIDERGKIVKEGNVGSDVASLSAYLKQQAFDYELIGIESGQLSISLCKQGHLVLHNEFKNSLREP